MHRVNPILKSRPGSEKTAQIYIEYLFDRSNRKLFPTGRRVRPEDWNQEKREVRKTHPEHQAINLVVNDLRRKIHEVADRAVLAGEVPSIRYITEVLESDLTRVDGTAIDLEGVFEKWIDDGTYRITPNALKHYKVFRNHVRGYMKWKRVPLVVSDFGTESFQSDFRRYLESQVMVNGKKGLMGSTVGAQFRRLKALLNFCLRNGYVSKVSPFSIKNISEESDNVYVSDAELDVLENIDLSERPALARTRDFFLVGCETGLRYSDLSKLNKTHFSDRDIRKPTSKTSKTVIIPISVRLRRVMERYDGDLPRAPDSAVFNRQIKDVCRLAGMDSTFTWMEKRGNRQEECSAPKYEVVSSHTCRRSFCTNQFLKGMPTFLIRKISGHTTEKAFLRYIRIDEEQAAEEMARRWMTL